MSVVVQSTSTAELNAVGTSITVNAPAGLVDGDMLVAGIASKSGAADFNVPAGWTAIDTTADANWVTSRMFWKIAASEGATFTFTATVAEKMSIAVLRIDGQATSSPLNASGKDFNGSTQAASVSPTITTTADNCLVLSFHGNREVSAPINGSPPAGMSQTVIAEISSGAAAAFAQVTQGTAGATGTKSWTLDSVAKWTAWTVAIAPEAGSGGGGGGGTSEGGRPVIKRGLYLKTAENTETGEVTAAFLAKANSSARIRGICAIIIWDNIETSKDVYDFSIIDDAITAANSIGKKLTIELRANSYGGSAENVTTIGVPSYIWQGSEYGGLAGAYGLARLANGQFVLRFWDPAVMDRVAKLYEQVLAYCSGKLPDAVFNNESTVRAIDVNRADANDYTPAKMLAQYKLLIERSTAAAGSDTRFCFVANFMKNGNNNDGGDLDTLYDYCADNDAGWSAPDPLSRNKPVDGWVTGSFRMQQQDLGATGTTTNPAVSGVAPIPYMPLGEQGAGAFSELTGGYLGSGWNLLDLMLYLVEQCGMEWLAITENYKSLGDYAGGELVGWQEIVTLLDDNNVPAADLAVLQAWAEAEDSSGGVTGSAVQTLPSLTQSAAGTIRSGTIVQTLPSLTQSASGATATFVASIAQTLPSLTQTAAGVHTIGTNVAAQTLPSLSQSAAARTFYWVQVVPGTESWRVQ